MKRILASLAIFLTLAVAATSEAEIGATLPPEFKTKDSIIASIVELHKGSLINVREAMSTMELRNQYGRTFVAWYNPFSGRAACYVHAYRFDVDKKVWKRYLSKIVESTTKLSVETAFDRVRVRNMRKEIVFEQRSYFSEQDVARSIKAGKIGLDVADEAKEIKDLGVREQELPDVPVRIFFVTIGKNDYSIAEHKGRLIVLCAMPGIGLAKAFRIRGLGDDVVLDYKFGSGDDPKKLRDGTYVLGAKTATWE